MGKERFFRRVRASAFVLSVLIFACAAQATALAEDGNAAAEGQEPLSGAVKLDEVNFPDTSFRDYCKNEFDLDGDEELSPDEIASAAEIDVEWDDTVTDLKGLEFFTELTLLKCSGTGIRSLDVGANTKLRELQCYYTDIDSLDVSRNPMLERLECYETGIASLDVSGNQSLIRLDCNNTPITRLDVTGNPELFALNCEDTQVEALDISANPKLYEVYITNTPISSMDYTNNPELVHIRISGTQMTSLNVSRNPKLAALYCNDTKLKELDLSNNPEMFEIFCYNSELEALDITKFAGLRTLDCHGTKLTKIDVRNNTNLAGLNVSGTGISELDISKNVNLQRLEYADTAISNLDLSANRQLRYLNCSNTNMERLDFAGYQNMEEVYCSNANVKTLKLPASVYGLDCSNNQLIELELTGLDLWLQAVCSPQSAEAYFKMTDGKLILDMKTVVPDTARVSFEDDPGYSYDAAGGLLTLKEGGINEVTYQYDTGAEPMNVNLTVKRQYNIVSGDKQNVRPGEDITFTSEAQLDTFITVLVDGAEVSSGDYTVSSGSTIITLKGAFISTLPAGMHTLTIVSSDGAAEAEFTVLPADAGAGTAPGDKTDASGATAGGSIKNNAPQTGDDANTLPYLLLAASAAACFAALMRLRKVKNI